MKKAAPKLRSLSIMIVENGKGDGQGFDVFLKGDTERLLKFQKQGKTMGEVAEEMSPAEFWGTTLFSLCVDALRQANVIKTSHTLHTGDAH